MKTFMSLFLSVIISLALTSCKTETAPVPVKKASISDFLGQWTIDVKGGGVSWLEVRQEQGYIDGDLLWIGGSVLPVANVFLSGTDKLIVSQTENIVRKRDEKNEPLRIQVLTSWLEVMRSGDKITGYLLEPKRDGTAVDSTAFKGTRLLPPPAAPDLTSVKYGKPVTLFNGKDLSGWKLINEKQKNGFSVANGFLSNNPAQTEGQPHISYGNLMTTDVYNDFNLKLEVNVPAGSNSGVYLRGMYEIQVLDSYGKETDSHNMGAVYSRIKPVVAAERPAGSWQTLDITLCDRHITVILNGIKIIDNQPVYGPTGGAVISDVNAPGPIYLQGDHGVVQYRNIVLTPIVK